VSGGLALGYFALKHSHMMKCSGFRTIPAPKTAISSIFSWNRDF